MVLLLSPGLAAVRSQLSTLSSGGLCLLGLLLTVGLYVGAFRGGVRQAAWVALSARP